MANNIADINHRVYCPVAQPGFKLVLRKDGSIDSDKTPPCVCDFMERFCDYVQGKMFVE